MYERFIYVFFKFIIKCLFISGIDIFEIGHKNMYTSDVQIRNNVNLSLKTLEYN